MIGTLDVLVIDCPNPDELADFYAAILPVQKFSDDPSWVELLTGEYDRPIIAFQKVENYNAPQWPGQDVPQQMHMDIKVDDLDEAEAAVLKLGATKTGSGRNTFRVYLDPAGHPFCLIRPND